MLRNTSHTHLVHEVWLHHKRAVGLERQLADVRPRSLAHAQRAASRQHDEYLLAVVPVNGRSRERRKSLLPHLHLHMASAQIEATGGGGCADAPHARRAARRHAASRARAPAAQSRAARQMTARTVHLPA